MNLESISRLSRSVPPPTTQKPATAEKSGEAAPASFETTQNIAQYQKMMEKLRAIPEVRPEKVEQAKTYLARNGGISDTDAAGTAKAMLRELGLDLES